jgi:hypothetical protein
VAPQMCRSTNRRESHTDTEVWFRIVHLGQEGHHGGPTAAYREQTVEIALWGPKGAFQSGNIGALTRQVPTDRVVNALPRRKGNPKPPMEPSPPIDDTFGFFIALRAVILSPPVLDPLSKKRDHALDTLRIRIGAIDEHPRFRIQRPSLHAFELQDRLQQVLSLPDIPLGRAGNLKRDVIFFDTMLHSAGYQFDLVFPLLEEWRDHNSPLRQEETIQGGSIHENGCGDRGVPTVIGRFSAEDEIARLELGIFILQAGIVNLI